MNRVFLFLLLATISIATRAQNFIITPKGLTNAADSSKRYIVINVDSVSARDLYTRVYSYIQRTWKNPEFTNNGRIEGELLHVKNYAADAIVARGNLGMKLYLNLRYSLNLDFKTGKVRYEIVDLNINTTADNGTSNSYYIPYTKGLVWCLYNKDGTVPKKGEGTKDQLEKYFNDQLKGIISAVKTNTAAGPVAVPPPAPKKDDF
jgi:hypothetical protein